MEQKRIPEDMFQNAFNLFNLLLCRKRTGIPCPHGRLAGKEVVEEGDPPNLNYTNMVHAPWWVGIVKGGGCHSWGSLFLGPLRNHEWESGET